jgi:hypothetical protein
MSAALARRVGSPDTSHNDILAQKRRDALTKQLSQTASPNEIAALLQVDDQLAVHDHKIDFLRGETTTLSEKLRFGRAEHQGLSRRLDDHIRFATEGLDQLRSDNDEITEAVNWTTAEIHRISDREIAVDCKVAELEILAQVDYDKLELHGAAIANLRQRLNAIEAGRAHQNQEQLLPRMEEEKLPATAQIALWAGAFAAAGAAIYSFIH